MKPHTLWIPKRVFLFSGHMIDKPDQQTPRFPAHKVPVAKEKILEELIKLDAGPEDLALTQGACGGDILFSEVCQERGTKVQWMQPFEEKEFLYKSVLRCGESWKIRYDNCKQNLDRDIRSLPKELENISKNEDPYVRCNLWLLSTALSYGVDKVYFICLWNGEKGDGTGGTAHMYDEVKNKTGNVSWIKTQGL